MNERNEESFQIFAKPNCDHRFNQYSARLWEWSNLVQISRWPPAEP